MVNRKLTSDSDPSLRVCRAALLNAEGSAMKLLSKKAVADRVGVHPEHPMRLARQGRFPRPIKLGDSDNSGVRFVAEEVDDWVAGRMAARQGEPV
jgi:predicted DNA-binding transcriptional regulator AlpA